MPPKPTNNAEHGFLTIQQVSEVFAVRQETVLRWIKDDDLTAMDISTGDSMRPRWRVAVEDLEDFMRRRSTRKKPEKKMKKKRDDSEVPQYYQ